MEIFSFCEFDVNEEILKYIKIRDNYYKLKTKYPHFEYAVEKFKHYRNYVTNLIRISKKRFLDNYFQANADDPHKLWSQLKTTLYNYVSTNASCECIYDNGIAVTNKSAIANKYNDFFIAKIQNLVNSQYLDDTDFHNFHAFEEYDIIYNFNSPQCTEDEVSLIIDNLSNSKAVDIYGMSNHFVKLHKGSLTKNITRLINDALRCNDFPDCLKIGLVNPIHKNGSKTEMANYRPITILPIFSKIFEYVIKRRLEDHLQMNNIICDSQFGYTKNSNTEIAVTHILNDVYNSVDMANATSLTCLDLSSAFDCVLHSLLINKLRKLKLTNAFLNLLSSYFDNRKQLVKIDDFVSNSLNVIHGVPQGGILSGLFFNFYINSINSLGLYSALNIYCDDISLVTSALNPPLLKEQIESDLARISTWLKFHYLFPNEKKTKYILFHNKRRHENFNEIALNIRFNNTVLERVENVKLLGLEIDETLSFTTHIYQIQKKVVAFMYALKRIRPLISEKTALMLYFSYIQSRLSYMNTIWATIPKYLMDAIEIIQRKALRIVFCKDRFCSRSELYTEKILPVSALCQLSSAILTFKMINKTAKINIELQFAHQVHGHATRNINNLVVPRMRTQLGAANFFVRAFSQYNNIPIEIRRHRSLNLFKTKLKEHLYIQQLWCDT